MGWWCREHEERGEKVGGGKKLINCINLKLILNLVWGLGSKVQERAWYKKWKTMLVNLAMDAQ